MLKDAKDNQNVEDFLSAKEKYPVTV